MCKPWLLKSLLAVCLCLMLAVPAVADVTLPGVFGDHMVLQCDQPIPLWGWAAEGEKVTVTLGEQTVTATAGGNGRWSLKLNPLKASGPHVLTVASKKPVADKQRVYRRGLAVRGQSNMEMHVKNTSTVRTSRPGRFSQAAHAHRST